MSNTLTYKSKGILIEVLVTHSNLLIGEFWPDVDGYYYFRPKQTNYNNEETLGSYWSDYSLIEIGTKLRELNSEINTNIQNFFLKN
jgi:hypothetical protein